MIRPAELFGILVTYRRPALLEKSLSSISHQKRGLDHLWIVDNDPSPESAGVVQSFAGRLPITYRPMDTNLGPAGARALAMGEIHAIANDQDWLLMLDDDDPLPEGDLVHELERAAHAISLDDDTVAGVGLRGALFDPRRARLTTPGASSSHIEVNCLHGGFFPLYAIRATRHVGTFDPKLFFSYEELEFGMRLMEAGYSLYMLPELLRSSGVIHRHPQPRMRPSLRLEPWRERRYYSVRNLIIILRRLGLRLSAVRYTLVVGLAKPLVNLALSPKRSLRHLRGNARAIRDGWRA